MIFLAIQDAQQPDRHPMGFNCGGTDATRATWMTDELRRALDKDTTCVNATQTDRGDCIVTVTVQHPSVRSVTALVRTLLGTWDREGLLV